MKLLLFWHYGLVKLLPDFILIDLFYNCKLLCTKKSKNKYDNLALYSYIKLVYYEMLHRDLLKNKVYRAFKKFNRVFKFEIYDEIQLIHLYDISYDSEHYHFKEHNFQQLRESYNYLKLLFIQHNTPFEKRKLAHDIYEKYRNKYKDLYLSF
jgi:hypothetical protein